MFLVLWFRAKRNLTHKKWRHIYLRGAISEQKQIKKSQEPSYCCYTVQTQNTLDNFVVRT